MQVAAREVLVVSLRRHLGQARGDDLSPQLARHAEAAHTEAQECPQEVADPTPPGEEIVDAAAPGPGRKAGMAGNPRPRSCVSIEVERIGERESGEVAERLPPAP